ncbi:MAG: response regulator transcription factor [Ignavibacteriales bacterium]|nr:response regulator transcription factor [Ignavibacteriales bacterium]
MKLILIEDEKDLAKTISSYLKEEQYNIDNAFTYEEALSLINIYEYDCALVDLMLPDGNGLDLIKIIKEVNRQCGIIIISAKESLDDKIYGLNTGADDYITKPFHLAELNARIKSLIRRKQFDGGNRIEINELTIDIDKRELLINQTQVELTRREFDLLLFFISNKERVLNKEAIVEHVWGENANAFDNYDFVYTHVKNLRKKLKENNAEDYLKSVYGIGYKFTLK